jgi:hypothetical protein
VTRRIFTWIGTEFAIPRRSRTADISWKRLDDALDAGFRLLCDLHKTIVGTDYELPPYDGADATRILTLADHADLFSHPLRGDATVT